jgi:hypothetical protein
MMTERYRIDRRASRIVSVPNWREKSRVVPLARPCQRIDTLERPEARRGWPQLALWLV